MKRLLQQAELTTEDSVLTALKNVKNASVHLIAQHASLGITCLSIRHHKIASTPALMDLNLPMLWGEVANA